MKFKQLVCKLTPFGVDARDEDAIKTLFQEVETNIAPIDVVIFNPGANVFFPITETTARVYRKVWEMAFWWVPNR